MARYIDVEDACKVIDRFLGYLDEEMIYRIKFKLKQDCPTADVVPKSEVVEEINRKIGHLRRYADINLPLAYIFEVLDGLESEGKT